MFLRCLLLIAVLSLAGQCLAGELDAPPPSTFAPIGDIDNQIKYFTNRIEKNLDGAAEYDEDRRGSVEKDASTLAVLAWVLTNHDSDGKSKANAQQMLTAAQALVDTTSSHAEATDAFHELRSAQSATESIETTPSEPVADLAVLMQQVPIVNNSLRRGVNGRRFKRSLDRTAGLATTLAALAQISSLDTAYCADGEDVRIWREICAEMRDAASRVNRAVRDVDQQTAKESLDELVESCDKCHHRFRD